MKKITILIISLLVVIFGMSALKPVFADDDAETIMRDLERDLAKDARQRYEESRKAYEAARAEAEAALEAALEEANTRLGEDDSRIEAAEEGREALEENREELLQGNDSGTATVGKKEKIIRYGDTPSTEPLPELAPDADDPNKLSESYFKVNEYLKLPDGEQPTQYFADEKYSPIVSFIIRIIDFATRIIGSIAIILLIITGFMFMFAQGNQQKLDEAKDMLKYTIIGLVVTFLSYIIVIFVQSIFTPI